MHACLWLFIQWILRSIVQHIFLLVLLLIVISFMNFPLLNLDQANFEMNSKYHHIIVTFILHQLLESLFKQLMLLLLLTLQLSTIFSSLCPGSYFSVPEGLTCSYLTIFCHLMLLLCFFMLLSNSPEYGSYHFPRHFSATLGPCWYHMVNVWTSSYYLPFTSS